MPASFDYKEPVAREVQEMINYRPHWIIRNGNFIFLLILLLLFAMTRIIMYPDKIKASSRLVRLNIQPSQTNFYAEAMISQPGLSKIKRGQQVIIKVEGYPYNDFGYLLGTVSYIPVTAYQRDSYAIKIDLPKGLETNYGKTISFRNGLVASAEIITDNRSLFDRLVGQLKIKTGK